MSQPISQREILNRAWDTVEREDREGLRVLAAQTVHPDCEWIPLLSGVDGRTYHGPDGMVEFFTEWLDAFKPRYEDRGFEQLSDDTILGTCRLRLESRETGMSMDREIALIGRFEDGLLRQGRVYDSRSEAMDAARELRDA